MVRLGFRGVWADVVALSPTIRATHDRGTHLTWSSWHKQGHPQNIATRRRVSGESRHVRRVYVPPFVDSDISIVVVVHVVKKFQQPTIRHCQAGVAECCLKLLDVQFPIAIAVDRIEEGRQLPVGALDKYAEF